MINSILNKVKEKIILLLDSDYLEKKHYNPQHIFIQNINKDFKKENQKKALLSYITLPLLKNIEYNICHTNYRELIQLISILIENKFQIDLCHYQDAKVYSEIKKSKYDLIIGSGEPYYKACLFNEKSKKILYCTTEYPKIQLKKKRERLAYFKKRHGYSPKIFWHNYYPDKDIRISDFLFVKGNTKTLETYNGFNNINSCFSINSSAFKHKNYDQITRNTKNTKLNFLWFGSRGAIGKGLDILIDIFNDLPNLKLTVAGLVESERKTLPKLNDNINDCGFIKLQSREFIELMRDNSFVIFPSCSEGMASGVLTCMNHGLIPIVSENCGIEVNDEIGYVIKDYKCESIKDIILKATKCSDQIIEKKQENVQNYTQQNYNIEKFTEIIKSHLEVIIK